MADEKEKKEEASAQPAEGKQAGGGMLPLIIALVAMPALAYATTTFVLLPKLQAALSAPAAAESHDEAEADGGDDHGAEGHGQEAADDGHGGGHGDGHGEGGAAAGNLFDLGKVLVNPKGSAGTRYLVAKYTLKGKGSDFGSKMEPRKPQLLDIASSVMASKSLLDLEQPGARNLIRNELLTRFNSALGGSVVKEIYITEFAIQ